MKRFALFSCAFSCVTFAVSVSSFVACTSNGDVQPEIADAASRDDDGASQSSSDASRSDGHVDSETSPCARQRAWAEACGTVGNLNCKSGFDAWCAKNDEALNSEAYRAGVEKCFDRAHCDTASRTACQYASYANATPTNAQRALVTAYCATCEPGNEAECAARATTYDAAEDVSDVFIAAWELSDPVVDKIRASCTGSTLDAGASDGGTSDGGVTCERAFALCAGDIYLNEVPDCP